MTQMYLLSLQTNFSLDEAWKQLEEAGIQVAYSEENKENRYLHIFNASPVLFKDFIWLKKYEAYDLPPIDWENQWQTHGKDFKEGKVHLYLNQFGPYQSVIELKPGAGFGDLSHPTTLLMLKLMAHFFSSQEVIDIGSGSGVLTLAALAMGAPIAYGIDIDQLAIEHARENARLNQLQEKAYFLLPSELQKIPTSPPLILMNMISSEQLVAWNSLAILKDLPAKILTSGIRKEERKTYLNMTKDWGWKMIEERLEDGWLGFCFEQKSAN